MKRSEMVKYMTQEYHHLHRGGWSEASDEERMSEVLKKLEEIGMLPPVVSGKKIPIGYDSKTGEVVAWDVSGRSINAWETEDETQ